MKPLDLTKQPPRSPREKLAGIYFLPRTIDKMRALLPGGNMGSYKIDGMSTRVLSTIGISVEDLQAEVARAASEDEVAAWVLERSDANKHDEANRVAAQRSINDVLPENRERIKQMYPDYEKIASGLFFDIIDADDAAMFARANKL
jgi:Domain of unknown function (DUF5069)